MDCALSVSGKQGIKEGILGEVSPRSEKPDKDARDVDLQLASPGLWETDVVT
jgi:hypothetical protein